MIGSEAIPNRAEISSENHLVLSGQWIVREAKRLHAEILSLQLGSQAAQLVAIDCRRIESLDLAGIQLVLAVRKKLGTATPVAIDTDTSTNNWFGLCGVGPAVVDFAP